MYVYKLAACTCLSIMAAEAYFVSKKDLLQWINSTLSLNLTKVEQVQRDTRLDPHLAHQ